MENDLGVKSFSVVFLYVHGYLAFCSRTLACCVKSGTTSFITDPTVQPALLQVFLFSYKTCMCIIRSLSLKFKPDTTIANLCRINLTQYCGYMSWFPTQHEATIGSSNVALKIFCARESEITVMVLEKKRCLLMRCEEKRSLSFKTNGLWRTRWNPGTSHAQLVISLCVTCVFRSKVHCARAFSTTGLV